MLNAIMLNVIMLNVIMLNVIMPNVIMLNINMLNVIMLNVIMLNVIMLNVIMLNVIMLIVVMLNVVAPEIKLKNGFVRSVMKQFLLDEIELIFSNFFPLLLTFRTNRLDRLPTIFSVHYIICR
jgi:hypothetical protein